MTLVKNICGFMKVIIKEIKTLSPQFGPLDSRVRNM